MIKTLRRKFILVAMISTASVLFLLIGSIAIINYHAILRDTDEILGILAENEGCFPGNFVWTERTPALGSGEEFGTVFKDRKGGRKAKLIGSWNEETPFETRYFSVLFDADTQEILDTDTSNIAAVSETDAEEYAAELLQSGKGKGFYKNYRYLISTETGGTRVIFVDCGTTLGSFRSILLIAIGVSVLGMLLVFLLVLIFSKMVFRPVLESDEKQKRFITDASHELKTPLTIIDANTEVLEMMEGENDFTHSIRNQVKRMTGLVQQMVTLTRMDEERELGPMTEVAFGELAEEISDSFMVVAASKGKSMKTDIDTNVKVMGDETTLTQLLSLLLDNAVKYSDEAGNIEVSLHKNGKKAVLQVCNTAAELPVGNLDILFDRFYRLDSSRNSETGGSGIGLSVAKAIVQTHKGKIHAQSDGKTIQFTVTL